MPFVAETVSLPRLESSSVPISPWSDAGTNEFRAASNEVRTFSVTKQNGTQRLVFDWR